MELTIVNKPSDFWDEFSDSAYPAILDRGGEIYEDDAHPGDSDYYIRVIKDSNDDFVNPTISGFSPIEEHEPNECFWDTGNILKQPSGDVGLFTLSKAYTELDIQYGADADTPLEMTFAQLNAIDVTVDPIPKADFVIDNMRNDGRIKNMASAPYDSQPLRDVNGVVLFDSNGEKLYPLKEF